MPDFTNYSHFDANAAYSTVKYGSNALVLEVELNEAQNILDNKISTLIKDKFGDGFYKTGSTLTYAAGTVTFANDKAFANGNIVTISSLALVLAEGEHAYLDVWQQEVTYSSTLKKYGNQQESNTVTNYIEDSRTAEETTRRTQIQYNLVKTTGVSGHTYLPLCTITSGALVDNRVAVGSASGGSTFNGFTMMSGSFTASSNGTTNCPIGIGTYNYATDYLMVVYLNQYLISGVEYTLNANHTSVDLNGFSLAAGEIVYFQVLKSISSVPQTTFNGNLITSGTVPDTAMINPPVWSWVSDTTLVADGKSISISGLSSYKMIKISMIANSSYAATTDSIYVTFNDDVGLNYMVGYRTIMASGAGSGSGTTLTNQIILLNALNGANLVTTNLSQLELNIGNMAAGKMKRLTGQHSGYGPSNIDPDGYFYTGIWENTTDAITKITLTANSGNFKAGSRFLITGVK